MLQNATRGWEQIVQCASGWLILTFKVTLYVDTLRYLAPIIIPGKTKRRFLVKFCLFSAYFPPMVPHLTFLRPHVYRICLFPPISAHFLYIFCLKWYPILVINSNMVPICYFSAHIFTDCAYFPPMFHSFSAYFPPNLLPIFCRSSCWVVKTVISNLFLFRGLQILAALLTF